MTFINFDLIEYFEVVKQKYNLTLLSRCYNLVSNKAVMSGQKLALEGHNFSSC